jgi:hypothetical protein
VVLGPFRDASGFSYMVRRFVGGFIDLGQRVLLAGQPWGPRLDEEQRDPRLDRPDEAAAAGIVRAIVHGAAAPRRSPAPHLLERFSWRRAAGRLLALVADAVAAGPAQRPG